ncbi:uncharacterized protein C8Q71DRAFT_857614 [Rhodofomes roseus]|uniref:DRBM domain-containing protein n=1 Tax=Rhodofomes roseus TaxID=34475 RepID=A0A4Y9Z198_9APHY|nr:uncharacterized protein C8Q71DRAFT_857614 [Rhodofomes roseus]KAH9837305.1 hypothetical protein C8Q71DRAFT_857614 [Rhodofomes roseus]TFY68586.1 hypothetical protein EVJ58_g904 [Rhodofomes roseus]
MATAVLRLNNYLQNRGQLPNFSWEESSNGPANALNWTMKCKLNGQVLGEATSGRKGDAKEAAAAIALRRLGQ